MVLRVSSPMLQRGSRKCGTLGAWFSEPPNKELEVLQRDREAIASPHTGTNSDNLRKWIHCERLISLD